MDKPKISYHILNADDTYTKQNSVYAGTYTGNEELSVTFRIWNNYRGTEDVEDLENFNIVAHFLTEEDNALLPYLTIAVNDMQLSSIIEDNAYVGTFVDPVVLSGSANTGSEEYAQNYIPVTVTFKADAGAYLKAHDLKSLVIEIVEL